MVSIEAGQGQLGLLIAVCNDVRFNKEIISRYEHELSQQGIHTHQITLDPKEPNLRAALEQVVEANTPLSHGEPSVVTVLGMEQLFFLRLGAERSAWEIFFGYSQWTREALRVFRFPVVLWVSHNLLTELSKNAPDFWSWRSGVFRFTAPPQDTTDNLIKQLPEPNTTLPEDEIPLLSITSLERLIEQKESSQERDENLGQLYYWAGVSYANQAQKGESADYRGDTEKAVAYFQQAVLVHQDGSFTQALANDMAWLGYLYESQGRYEQAEPLYEQALALSRKLLGEEHPAVASSINNLAALYDSQGRYEQAEPLYVQALALRRKLLGQEHPDVATSLNNLGAFYYERGRYQEAEPLLVKALALREKLLGNDHPDTIGTRQGLAMVRAMR
ncbi:tetratricopeptide repeat protein [Candidatus Cyanaurora vandensis]|uniref:tetratricopeptide repeat protein n=2 Tax=Candidatus Cyanaurora vandensis TaxID=2714958 RepID=UPI00257C4C9E|nr:tetratricopeptide repeat protein [Candidatus Cyanaurora vandensis]